jgi:hypothetical protein
MRHDQGPSPTSPKATGPRTVAGKKRSRRNALSHGIFAKHFLLKDEDPEEFSSLCEELREILGAKGAVEEEFILQLATLLLRNRRLLKAETGEIARSAEFLKLELLWEQNGQAANCTNELVAQHLNPAALKRIVELLIELRNHFELKGFDQEKDTAILRTIYGLTHLKEGFPAIYFLLHLPNHDMDRREKNSHAYGDRRKKTLELIENEITKFSDQKYEIEQNQSQYLSYAQPLSLVPQHDVLERLLRYESHLSREMDRVLNRLELCKRLRRGLRVLPSIAITPE